MDPKAITRKLACKPCRARLIALLLLALAAAGLAGCDENDPTGTELTTSTEGAQAGAAAGFADGDVPAAVAASDVTALGTIALPINQSIATSGVAFGITQTGSGPVGIFKINKTSSSANAVLGQTNGQSGAAVRGIATGLASTAGIFESTNPSSPQPALIVNGKHNGSAGSFLVLNSNNGSTALRTETSGSGPAFDARAGTGPAGRFFSRSAFMTLLAENDGLGAGIRAVAVNQGNAGVFDNTNTSNTKPALLVRSVGDGFAGVFESNGSSTGKGVLIQTKGGAGLQVVNGSKNAVVSTPSGSKALYTEESTEVWFTDYGFGKLTNGKGRILFDPSFAQTINADESYHVFVQPYGRAELYVAERTPLGFTVALKDGDPNAEFSYRIVAKRLGFEGKRLEAAPWVDHPPAQD
jgi:hypothetical protein